MSDQYVCLHGHFYQPTRENPWLNAIEVQDAASPYHDWNERITAESYARNAASRLLDNEQRITQIWNNYAKINFNFGPTLLQWLSQHTPDTYTKILEADRQSRSAFYGHGNAIAQIYNHLIMPLATERDKITQVIWAMRDFERRFRRRPEGMWLSETAVDRATLEVLAAQGIAFTLLAPHQAKRILRPRESQWVEVSPETLDVTIPYRCSLPQGKSITIFFYDSPIARAVAFEGLLNDGRELARRLSERLAGETSYARLLTVATDGETYGHHHRFGEMALSSALHQIEEEGRLRVTNLAAYVAAHPPTVQVEIQENTSWSCPHGIERWRSNCGCTTGKGHQRWRGPLREAITWLTNELDTLYETEGGKLFREPWKARNDAVDLIDPAPGSTDAFFARHATGPLAAPQRIARLRLLEMQRQGLLMQSSDGWFFDDIARGETVQILTHAARTMELASTFGKTLEEQFIRQLQAAPGNTETYPDGAVVYDKLVRPRVTSPERITAMHAITSLVEPATTTKQAIYAWALKHSEEERTTSGDHTLVVGRLQIQSTIVEEETASTYALVHFGGHEVHCAVRLGWTDEEYARFRDAVRDEFGREILSEVIRSVDLAFGPAYYTLKDLPLDDRRHVLASLLEQTLANLEREYRQHYLDNKALMVYLRDAQVAVPPALVMAATFVLARDLEQTIGASSDGPLSPRAFEILEELRSWGREAYPHRFEPLLRYRLESALGASAPLTERLQWATQVLDLAQAAGITLDLWEAQNRFYRLLQRKPPAAAAKLLEAIGQRLTFNMAALERQPTTLEES